MAQSSRPCKGCGEPIYRTVQVAPIPHYHGPECRPRCDVEGCDKPRHGNVYCSAHHTRWKRTGDPLTALERQPNSGACSVGGCGQPMRKRGWCASHYSMWQRQGEVKPFTYKWGDGGYFATHALLSRTLGQASARRCVDCDGPAAEWSYDHQDPNELVDTSTAYAMVYTRDLSHYEPRCKKCHRLFDENPISMRGCGP